MAARRASAGTKRRAAAATAARSPAPLIGAAAGSTTREPRRARSSRVDWGPMMKEEEDPARPPATGSTRGVDTAGSGLVVRAVPGVLPRLRSRTPARLRSEPEAAFPRARPGGVLARKHGHAEAGRPDVARPVSDSRRARKSAEALELAAARRPGRPAAGDPPADPGPRKPLRPAPLHPLPPPGRTRRSFIANGSQRCRPQIAEDVVGSV